MDPKLFVPISFWEKKGELFLIAMREREREKEYCTGGAK